MSEIITLEKEVCKLASGSVVVRVRTNNVEWGAEQVKGIEKIVNNCFEEYFNLKELKNELSILNIGDCR